MFPYTISQNSITVLINGVPKVVDVSHPNYKAVYSAIKEERWSDIESLIDVVKAVVNFAKGKIQIVGGVVYYEGVELHNYAVTKLLSLMHEGFNINPLINFLSNLLENPSYRAVQELYQFLEKGNMPITEDGYFVVYKKVRSNYKDIHSGTFDNSIGQVISMPRNLVDEDSSRTCSSGLHVCSFDYLAHFSSSENDRVVACKVNPRDVVAIPKDYNDTKMRVCQYTVIEDVTDSYYGKRDILAQTPIYGTPKQTVMDFSTPEQIVDSLTPKFTNTGRAVAQMKDGKILALFPSAKEAEEKTGVFGTNIIQVCRGFRKSAGGFKWMYN